MSDVAGSVDLAGAVAVLDAADPVAAFLGADRAGALVALPTSGTRDRPRTVVRTTASWTSSFDAVTALAGWGAEARVWVPGPLSATMNLFAAVHTAWVGAARVDGLAAASHAQLTPALLRRLLDDGVDLSGRTVVVAGDTLDAALRARAEGVGARVVHYYGAAELSFVAWGRDADDLHPFPGVDVRVADGVVRARSPFLALGTTGAPGPLRHDADGYATVGDRGRLDDGRLVVLGRDETVVTGGATVLIADVEAALRPGLRGEVAVVGLPHPTLGAVVAAVLTDDADREAATVRARDLGAGRPRRWFVRSTLPLTGAGKLDRRALVETLERST